MSNNNAHGHANQTPQNPSWNPLQIPSYIPRQPQLAHMSNERSLVRSPLAWHAAAPPPDSLYNFMSASHKNLEHQVNPLLPPYVRGPPPFDSMDLSLQSSRNTSSTLNKTTGGHPGMLQHEYGHKQQSQHHHQHQQQQPHMHSQNNYPSHNLPANASPTGGQQQAQSQQPHAQQQHTAMSSATSQHARIGQQSSTPQPHPSSPSHATVASNPKYLNSNGKDCEPRLPPDSTPSGGNVAGTTVLGTTANINNNSGASAAGPSPMHHYMHESGDMRVNENYPSLIQMSRGYDSELQSTKAIHKPVELVNKDCNYPSLLANKIPHTQQVPPRKQSPLGNYQHQQHQQQQQHQHKQTFNNPPATKRNGPQHSPTSPVMHPPTPVSVVPSASTVYQQQQQQPPQPMELLPTTIHGNSSVNDYSQLHLQHQQNSYLHQQHLPPHAQLQNLHYTHQHHMQQHSQQQPHHQQIHPPQHQQQQQLHQPMSPPYHRNLSNFDAYVETKVMPAVLEKPRVADLSLSASAAAHRSTTTRTSMDANCIRSPEALSSDGSVDSNSNSSGARRRRGRPTKAAVAARRLQLEQEAQQQPVVVQSSTNCSHENTSLKRNLPRKFEINSPAHFEASLEHTTNVPPAGMTDEHAATTPPTPEKAQSREGCPPPSVAVFVAEEVETRDRIADTGLKTASNDANSNSSFRSNPDLNGSPKTKKQRQAIKMRNAELQNSNSNCSTHAYGGGLVATANDNAVLAEELRSGQSYVDNAPQPAPPLPAAAEKESPMSPQSNSHSSSSSSSSSSCSNSSHNSRSVHVTGQNAAVAVIPITGIQADVEGSKEASNTDADDAAVLDQLQKPDDENDATCAATELSPRKACFEEVETKLEEMFAGIEDEPLPQEGDTDVLAVSTTDAEVSADLTLALELSAHSATHNNTSEEDVEKESEPEQTENVTSALRAKLEPTTQLMPPTPPTKAAKKSTFPSPIKIATPPSSPRPTLSPLEPPVQEEKPTLTSPVMRINPPPRRLSVVLSPVQMPDASNDAKISPIKTEKLRDDSSDKELLRVLDDELPSTSAAAAAALAAKALSATKQVTASEGNRSTRKKGRPKGAKGKKSRSMENSGASAAPKSTKLIKNSKQIPQQKQRRRQNSSDEEAQTTREASTIVEPKFKSPFILVKRDGSISVINAPTAEDLSEKQPKTKKPRYSHDRKKIPGMHSSTLSNKYDADTTDSTWICVFCKRGPHKLGIGDLFGPYLITIDCEEYRVAIQAPDAQNLDELFSSKRRRSDMVQPNARNLPVMPTSVRQPGTPKRKRKQSVGAGQADSLDPLDCTETTLQQNFLGMSKVSANSYEVWVHEDCVVWAPDVCIVGARVRGLDAAVWDSTRHICVLCGKPGAIVCCLQRNCKIEAHVTCAREGFWSLDEIDLKVRCKQHAPTTMATAVSNVAFTASAVSTVADYVANLPPPNVAASESKPLTFS